jgi:NAD(P)-dependent dehydrogenase (short-subunit alcohol dehydrogenase family)
MANMPSACFQLRCAQGAAAGLGFETARVLAAVGGRVTVAARSQVAADDTVARLREVLGADGAAAHLSSLELDLSRLSSIEAGAARFLAATPALDVLICNAGVMACPLTTTHDGFEMQVGARVGGSAAPLLLACQMKPSSRLPVSILHCSFSARANF